MMVWNAGHEVPLAKQNTEGVLRLQVDPKVDLSGASMNVSEYLRL